MTEAISMQSSIPATPPPQNHLNLQPGDFVWFDAGFGFSLPGEIVEVHRAAQIVIVSAIIDGKVSVKLQCEIEIASYMDGKGMLQVFSGFLNKQFENRIKM